MMTRMQQATLETGFRDARPRRLQDCVVRASGDRLEVYLGSEDRPALVGRREGAGHYRVRFRSSGVGSLHRFAGESVLEGSWRRGGMRGYWRLELSGEAASAQVVQFPATRMPGPAAGGRRRPVRRRPRVAA